MQAAAEHGYRPASLVVGRVDKELVVERDSDGVRQLITVISFDYVLCRVIELAVAD